MSGADGPEAPSAPEAPSPQEPQEQPEPAEPAGEEGAESRRPRLLPVWLLLGAAVIAGGAWAVTERMGGEQSSSDEASVPLITASAEPWKVRPDDPGGMEIPNQGTLIYETLTTADPEEAPEQILPPPEEPMSPPLPEADRAEELAVAASGAPNEGATQQPNTVIVDELAPSPVEEATPVEPEAPEIAAIQEELPTEPEAPTEPISVEEEAPLELEPREIDGILLPPPPKPGTLAAARIEESPLTDLGEPVMTEALPPEAEPEVADDELPELEPETLALIDDLLQRQPDPEAPSEPMLSEDADPVPLPPYKPTRIARAAPVERTVEETVATPQDTAPAPVPSDSRTWRYVQLGAADSRSPLEGHWEMLRRRHEDVLIGLSPLIMPVDSGASGITYRLRAGPLSNQAAAQRVCAQLKARGLDCFVPRD